MQFEHYEHKDLDEHRHHGRLSTHCAHHATHHIGPIFPLPMHISILTSIRPSSEYFSSTDPKGELDLYNEGLAAFGVYLLSAGIRHMDGIEEAYCDVVINAVHVAYRNLLQSSIIDAISHSKAPGKKDTLGLDAIPEIDIFNRTGDFDRLSMLIAEERGKEQKTTDASLPAHHTADQTFFLADPTDRSRPLQIFLEKFLNEHTDPNATVEQAFREDNAQANWESQFESPIAITGAHCALTCIRYRLPICSALVNFMTSQIVVACEKGIFTCQLPDPNEEDHVDLKSVQKYGSRIYFPPTQTWNEKQFVTYNAKSEYEDNLKGVKLASIFEAAVNLQYGTPGGPSRVLYLSDLQNQDERVGYILSNGEKIGEWIHWLTIARYGRNELDYSQPALNVYEIDNEDSLMKNKFFMAPSEVYSILRDLDKEKNLVEFDVERFRTLHNPSLYRSTLLIVPKNNRAINQKARQSDYRRIVFP